QVLDQRVHHHGVVVAVVERTGAGEEVEVFVAVLIPLLRTQGAGEGSRPGPAVAANGGFAGLEDIGLVRRGVRGTFGHHWSPFDFLIVRLPRVQALEAVTATAHRGRSLPPPDTGRGSPLLQGCARR